MHQNAYNVESWLKEHIVVKCTQLNEHSLNIDSDFVGTWQVNGGYVPRSRIVYVDSTTQLGYN